MNKFTSVLNRNSCKHSTMAYGHSSEMELRSYVTMFWLLLSPVIIGVVLWLGYFLDGQFGSSNWQTNCLAVLLYSFIYLFAFVLCELLSAVLLKEKPFAACIKYDNKSKQTYAGRFCYVYGSTLLISVLTNGVLLASIYSLGHLWWLVPSLGFVCWSLFRLVIQNFFTSKNLISEPLLDDELTEHLYELADHAGFPTIQLHRLKKDSAFNDKLVFVAPIEKTARIHFSQDVLNEFTKEELAVLFAHELGHLKYRDLLQRGVASALLNVSKWFAIALMLYMVNGYASSAYLTLAVVTSGGIILNAILPSITGMHSRYNEKKADNYALDLTSDPASFKSAFNQVVNLIPIASSNFVVEFLYATHPSIDSRIAAASKWNSVEH